MILIQPLRTQERPVQHVTQNPGRQGVKWTCCSRGSNSMVRDKSVGHF